jgi:hypothetical protein
MELTEFLTLLAQALLVIALPVLIAAGIQWLRLQAQRLGDERLATAERIISTAVAVAEQTGVLENLASEEKRQKAISIAEDWLAERGIQMDLNDLANVVEAEVVRQFKEPTTTQEDTPAARQELLEKAVESAVLAAEQSGLAGLIENVGREKKAYALKMVNDYLSQYGVTVPEDLISGLIEATLLRFKLAARGQLPSES